MFKTIKKLFTGKQPQAEPEQPKTYRLGVPSEPIPFESLQEMKQFFAEMEIVRRAAYVLFERTDTHEISYFVALDIAVPAERTTEAVDDIAQSLISHSKVQYKGRWPMDFGPWDSMPIESVLSQEPGLVFYAR